MQSLFNPNLVMAGLIGGQAIASVVAMASLGLFDMKLLEQESDETGFQLAESSAAFENAVR